MKMEKVLIVAKRDYVSNVRGRNFLLMAFGLPVLMALIIGAQAYFAGQLDAVALDGHEATGMVDYSGLDLSRVVGAGGPLNATNVTVFGSEAELRAALTNNSIGSGFIVQADYLETGNVSVLIRSGELSQAAATTLLQPILLAGLTAGMNQEVAKRVSDPYTIQVVQVGDNGKDSGKDVLQSVVGMVFALLLIFSIFITSNFLLQSVVEEKENRMIEVILSSVSATELMAGKIMGLAALALTQIAIWLLGAALILSLTTSILPPELSSMDIVSLIGPATMVVYILYFIGGFFLFASIFAGLGALSTSMREGTQLTSVLILPAVTPFWFLSAMMAEPNGPVSVFLSMFPLSAPLGMIMRMNFTVVPPLEIAASLAILFCSVAFTIWASAKVFRASMLMYGKRPNLGEIISFLKQG
ncbi:MAG: ABC transporter permease [Candidatus Micrarchaeia archaeon]|jgi:ABC-2 type transport system permease protein